MFQGREYIAALNVYDFRNRAYSPDLGRFLQMDPIGFKGGNHLYRFCGNNPVTATDPTGQSIASEWGAQPCGGGPGGDTGGGSYAVVDATGVPASTLVAIDSGWATSEVTAEGVYNFSGSSSGFVPNTALSGLSGALDAALGAALGGSDTSSDGTSQSTGGSLTSVGTAILDAIGKIWNIPNDVLGLALGLADMAASIPFAIAGKSPWPGISFGDNAIQFTNLHFGFGALTLGNVQLYPAGFGPTTLTPTYWNAYFNPYPNGTPTYAFPVGMHEEGHTYQSEVLGPFFLPTYLLNGGISQFNPFENAADVNALTGQGWWPW
jgi:RHS repeat-associated protein